MQKVKDVLFMIFGVLSAVIMAIFVIPFLLLKIICFPSIICSKWKQRRKYHERIAVR